MSPAQYRTKREQLGLTQAGLAAFLEVTRETVNRRESGEQPITHEAALAISSLRPAKTKRATVTSNSVVSHGHGEDGASPQPKA